jgi:hypothetical protein
MKTVHMKYASSILSRCLLYRSCRYKVQLSITSSSYTFPEHTQYSFPLHPLAVPLLNIHSTVLNCIMSLYLYWTYAVQFSIVSLVAVPLLNMVQLSIISCRCSRSLIERSCRCTSPEHKQNNSQLYSIDVPPLLNYTVQLSIISSSLSLTLTYAVLNYIIQLYRSCTTIIQLSIVYSSFITRVRTYTALLPIISSSCTDPVHSQYSSQLYIITCTARVHAKTALN